MQPKSKKHEPSDPQTPPIIHPDRAKAFLRRRKKRLTVDQYVDGIRAGNRVLLGQAITLVESQAPRMQAQAKEIVERCLPFAGHSIRIGITGTPGVGKSTFIEALGKFVTQNGRRLAVLTIDPSSKLTHGSILGDKTRMQELSSNPKAFIRPSPAGESLGGVARKTRETILLCEAAGYDTIIVETVGVGQSETTVHSMVDFFLLLLLPGAGDELQGIKRGIVEMADLIAVNKADGDRLEMARKAQREYTNAIHLFPPKESRWTVPVVTCSSLDHAGIEAIWQQVLRYLDQTRESGFFQKHRRDQARFWLYENIRIALEKLFFDHPDIQNQLDAAEEKVLAGTWSSFRGADELIDLFIKKFKEGGSRP